MLLQLTLSAQEKQVWMVPHLNNCRIRNARAYFLQMVVHNLLILGFYRKNSFGLRSLSQRVQFENKTEQPGEFLSRSFLKGLVNYLGHNQLRFTACAGKSCNQLVPLPCILMVLSLDVSPSHHDQVQAISFFGSLNQSRQPVSRTNLVRRNGIYPELSFVVITAFLCIGNSQHKETFFSPNYIVLKYTSNKMNGSRLSRSLIQFDGVKLS